MRTKTLLLTAALGLVGAATTMAQVYSVNTVGYVNVPLPAGFAMIANPLQADDNTVAKLFAGVPDGSIIYKFTNKAYQTPNSYDSSMGGWDNPAQTLVPGEGIFIRSTAAWTVTFVGQVMEGDLKNPLVAGFNMVSSMVPQAGKLQTDLKMPTADGDMVYRFVNLKYESPYSYDSSMGGWDPKEPEVTVGEAFWVRKVAAASWDRNFKVSQ